MDSYLPIIFHLKEIASLYKRSDKYAITPVDCHTSIATSDTISCDEELKKSGSFRVSEPFQPVACCGYCFRHPSHYKAHLNTIYHNTRLERTCSVCAKYFQTKEALTLHMKEHDSLFKFNCEVCGRSFKLSKLLFEHMRQEHISFFTVECDKCQYITWKFSNLIRHRIRFHREALPVLGIERSDYKPVTCCGKTFRYPSHLKRHQAHCGRKWCRRCEEYFDGEEALKQHLSDAHNFVDGKWVCMICSENFATNGNLTVHLKSVHLRSTVFECSKCSFTTTRKDRLARHFHKMHINQVRSFKCDTCGRTFRRKDTLAVHITKIHLSNIPHCEICSKQFKSVEEVEKHKRLHRPCQMCGMKFRTVKQRESHCRKHLSEKILMI